MSASQEATYRRARRIYTRAMDVIEHASERIWQTSTGLSSFDIDRPSFEAMEALNGAARRVNDELTAITKAVGVGVYQPYGKQSKRRS